MRNRTHRLDRLEGYGERVARPLTWVEYLTCCDRIDAARMAGYEGDDLADIFRATQCGRLVAFCAAFALGEVDGADEQSQA